MQDKPRLDECPFSMGFSAFCEDRTQCYNTRTQSCDGTEHCADGTDERCGIFRHEVKIALVAAAVAVLVITVLVSVCKYCSKKSVTRETQQAASNVTREQALGPNGRYAWYLAPNSVNRTTGPTVYSEPARHPITVPSSDLHSQISSHSWHDLRRQTAGELGSGASRSWYDMSDNLDRNVVSSSHRQPLVPGNNGAQPVSSRSWYDVSDRTVNTYTWRDRNRPIRGSDGGPVSSRSWYDVSGSSDVLSDYRRRNNLYTASPTPRAPPGDIHSTPPPPYSEVVYQATDPVQGEAPPPSYQDVLNRESSI